VPIFYEGRLAKLELSEAERPKIDPGFEEVAEGEEVERKEGLKSKWAQLAAVVGSEKRLRLVAADLVDHFEKRLEVMDGKALVVCMSRRTCVELMREIVALRPQWAGEGDDAGAIKVVMTGSAADPLEWQPHIRSKSRREALARRFRVLWPRLYMPVMAPASALAGFALTEASRNLLEGDERFLPPVRREHLRLARERRRGAQEEAELHEPFVVFAGRRREVSDPASDAALGARAGHRNRPDADIEGRVAARPDDADRAAIRAAWCAFEFGDRLHGGDLRRAGHRTAWE
jgi:hypothetical protein